MTEDRLGAKKIGKSAVAEALENQYGFEISNAKLDEGGCTNAGWRLTTNKGKLIAKIFGPDEGTREWIENEADMYEYLNNQGINTPKIIKTNEGAVLGTVEYEGQDFSVMVMILEPVRRVWATEITDKQLANVAKTLAKMHLVLTKYPGFDFIKNRPKFGNTEGDQKPIEIIRKWKELDFSQKQIKEFDSSEKEMFSYLDKHPQFSNLPETVIHADLGLEHTLYLPNDDVYFFDFADRIVNPKIDDVATFLAMLYGGEDIDLKKWEELKTIFLTSYNQVNPINEDETSNMNRFMMTRMMGANQYLAILRGDTPNYHINNIIRRDYELGMYLIQNNNN
jgi:Ser/Thr protein kinase RdoA (MazF antagonist)